VGGTCAALIGTSLAPGASTSCTFELEIPPGTAGDVVTDTIAVTLADDDGNDTTPTDTEEVPLTDVAPTIVVTKSNDPDTVAAPGAEVDFEVTVENTSWEPVTVTSITDAVNGGTPFEVTAVAGPVVATTCAIGVEIPAGGTYGCTFTLVVASDEAATIPDEVVATVVDDDGTEATAGDAAVTTVTAVADLSIEKRLLDDALLAGETGTYELAVTNAGPRPLLRWWSPTPCPNRWSRSRGPVKAGPARSTARWCGASSSRSPPMRRPWCRSRSRCRPMPAGIEVTNVAEVGSDTDDPDDANNRDEVTDEIGDALPIGEDRPQPANPIEAVIVATGGPEGLLAMLGAIALIAGMVMVASRRLAADRMAEGYRLGGSRPMMTTCPPSLPPRRAADRPPA
jgi:hypothetical protein